MKTERRSRKGFSVAELMVVLAIIIVIATIAFIAVFAYLRSMTKLEYDGYAKEIFIAAQNHLATAESQGYLLRTDAGTEEVKMRAVTDTGDGVYVFVVTGDDRESLSSDKSLLGLMLPYASIDETVRDGCFLIRYHKDSAQVLDVFYWSETGRYSHKYVDSDYMTFLANRENRDALRTYVDDSSVIGYYGGVTAQGLVESALEKCRRIESMNYDNLVVSIKSSDVLMCAEAYERFAEQSDYPLHVGITEAGTLYSGNIKSAIGLSLILSKGIGDTIRVSLTGDPVEEIRSAKLILRTLGLRKGGIEVVSCPTCGRTRIVLISLAAQVEEMVRDYPLEIKVAVMGCVVNGPGEAREADIGIAGGLKEGLLIRHGEVIRKVPEEKILETLKQELDNWQE